jgi:hypothetical protein
MCIDEELLTSAISSHHFKSSVRHVTEADFRGAKSGNRLVFDSPTASALASEERADRAQLVQSSEGFSRLSTMCRKDSA